jgi:hypothetical protein
MKKQLEKRKRKAPKKSRQEETRLEKKALEPEDAHLEEDWGKSAKPPPVED